MWRAVHPGFTETKRIPDRDGGPLFQLGFWPPLKDVELRVGLRGLGRTDATLDPIRNHDELVEIAKREVKLFREFARWGCQGWAGGDGMPPAVLVQAEVEGRRFQALSEESLDALYVNGLLPSVALAAVRFNVTSETEKKRPESPSPSDTPSSAAPTAVADATVVVAPRTTTSASES